MKKLLLIFFLSSFMFVSCGYNILSSRKVHIVIPQHPWEDDEIKLWYTLKWNDGEKTESLYLDANTREADIVIPQNSTVYICAYPLGDMLPFGAALIPSDHSKQVVLSQNEGYIAHLLINSDLEAAVNVNFNQLMQLIDSCTYDTRVVDDATLISDIINGRLSSSSIEIKNKIAVPEITVPNGDWISEWESDASLFVRQKKTDTIEIPTGVFRYYCKELDRELRIVAEANGTVFHSLRYGMIGL